MQILLLSLLVLLILIGQIYKIIYDKKKMSQEAFDMVNKKKHQEEYWKNSIRYYNSLGDKRLQNTIEQIEKNESTDNFVALDSNNVLVETFHGESSRRSTENEIETCRSLTKCEQLDEFPNCGYCGSSNKFDYDGGTGIAPDVCLPSKEIAAYSDGTAFEMTGLVKTLKDIRCNYIIGVDYKIFINLNVGTSDSTEQTKQLFVTYEGMIKILYSSRSDKAMTFRSWATETLFTVQMGSEEDKEILGSTLIGQSVKNVRAVFKTCSKKVPCIYRFSLGTAKVLRNTMNLFYYLLRTTFLNFLNRLNDRFNYRLNHRLRFNHFLGS